MKFQKNRSDGFTLIELLVVISIIAVLMSIMMPALSKARESAKFVICKSNIKNVGLGGRLWSEDNEGWVPPALWDRENPYSDNGLLLPYLGEDTGADVMRCPVVPTKYEGKTYGEADLDEITIFAKSTNYINSYGMNLMLCSPNQANCPGTYNMTNHSGGTWGKDNVFFYKHGNCKLSTVRKPANTIFFAESCMYYSATFLFGYSTKGPFSDPAPRGRRHYPKTRRIGQVSEKCGVMNIAWIDGSVSEEPEDFEEFMNGIPRYNKDYWTGE